MVVWQCKPAALEACFVCVADRSLCVKGCVVVVVLGGGSTVVAKLEPPAIPWLAWCMMTAATAVARQTCEL